MTEVLGSLRWVGRTPRSAADGPVGLFSSGGFVRLVQNGFRATRADQGVRPTSFSPERRWNSA
jgi:hypothetical protein